jgi:hypothetical protein
MDPATIIAELRRVADQRHSDCLSRSTFAELANISTGAVEKTFGSWNEGILAAGLKPLPQGGLPRDDKRRLERVADPPIAGFGTGRISDDLLLSELSRLAKQLGRRPSGNQITAKGKYDSTVYIRRWGSVAKAYEAASSRSHVQ